MSKRRKLAKKQKESHTMNSKPAEPLYSWNLRDLIELIKDYVESPDFVGLLDVRTVIALGLVCKNFRKIFNKEYVQMVIRLGNLEPPLRLPFWAYRAPWIDIEKRLRVRLSVSSIYDTVYGKLLERIGENPSISSVRSTIQAEFDKFNVPNVSDWRIKCENIVINISEEAGYFPGLGLIASGFLQAIEDEELAFWAFSGVLAQPWVGFSKFSGFQFHLFMLTSIAAEHFADQSENRDLDSFIRDAIISFCTQNTGCLPQICDILLMDGWIGVYKIAIALLELLIQEPKVAIRNSLNIVLRNALKVVIPRETVENSINKFYQTEAQKLLIKENDTEEFPPDLIEYITERRIKVNKAQMQHEKDLEHFNIKIASIDKEIATISKKHFELKAEYKGLQIDLQGLSDQLRALEVTKNVLSYDTNRKITKDIKQKEPSRPLAKFGTSAIISSAKPSNKEVSLYQPTVGLNDKTEHGGYDKSITCAGTERFRDDLEVVQRKINRLRLHSDKIITTIKQRAEEIAECESEITDYKFRKDILRQQVEKLENQLNNFVRTAVEGICTNLKNKIPIISINLYYP